MGAKNWYEITMMYAEANILGLKRRERYAGASRWFEGNVLYQHGMPIGRLEKTRDGDWLLLRTSACWLNVMAVHKPEETWEDWQKVKRKRNPSVPDLVLDDICVGAHYAGGKLTGKKLHWAMHKMFLDEAVECLNEARRVQARRLSGNLWRQKHLVDALEATLKYYNTYRTALAPWLPDLPDLMPALMKTISDKVERYESPKEATKRERRAAREEAKQAFLGEEKRKNKRV
jgi:hypothetical protein